MAKQKFNAVCLVLLLVSRQSKSQLLVINGLVPIKYKCPRSQTGGVASPPGFERSLLPGAPTKEGNLPILPRGEGGRKGGHTYLVHTYLTKTRIL